MPLAFCRSCCANDRNHWDINVIGALAVVGGHEVGADQEQDHLGLLEALSEHDLHLLPGADHALMEAADAALALEVGELRDELVAERLVCCRVGSRTLSRATSGTPRRSATPFQGDDRVTSLAARSSARSGSGYLPGLSTLSRLSAGIPGGYPYPFLVEDRATYPVSGRSTGWGWRCGDGWRGSGGIGAGRLPGGRGRTAGHLLGDLARSVSHAPQRAGERHG